MESKLPEILVALGPLAGQRFTVPAEGGLRLGRSSSCEIAVSDPALSLVTLTGCEVSVDKSVLRAYVSCEQSRYEEVTAAFQRAKGRIRLSH